VGVLAHVKSDKDTVEVLLEPADMVERLLEDIQYLRPQVEELEYKLDLRGQGVRSVEEIKLEINTLQNKRYPIWQNFWGFECLLSRIQFFS
jgi:DNA repair protein RAD50